MFEYAREICAILRLHDHEGYVVGGAVRDFIMSNEIHDTDIATDATPNQIIKIFEEIGYKIAPIGKKFGTVQVIPFDSDEIIEITTYRSEEGYSDKRHPDTVKFEKSLVKDLSRRDFTINAIAYDPITEEYVDPYHGQRDLCFKTLRCVGNPILRFSEDPLRMMRLFRFASKLGFSIDLATENAVGELNYLIREISGERVRDELLKMMETDNPKIGIMGMFESQLLFFVLPEVDRLYKVKQPPHHHKYDVFTHCIETMQNLANEEYPNNPYIRLAGLLHDIGKLDPNNEAPYFPYHIDDGMKMLTDIFNRLKISNENRAYVRFLIRHHMDGFIFGKKYNSRSIRRYLSKINNPLLLLDLRFLMFADVKATGYNKTETLQEITKWIDDVFKVIQEKQPFTKKDLVINGKDLLDLGIPACPQLGHVQQMLLDEVLDDPKKNTREYLLSRAKQIHQFLLSA